MMPIALSVNGRKVQAMIEPRTHLADFLREHCRLTGTHLGCEHGVCGACTVLIDDKPARSCITYAVQCDGVVVQTIEGFDDDPVMQELRTAFSRSTRCSAASARPACSSRRATSCGGCRTRTRAASGSSFPAIFVGARDIWALSTRWKA
jgi:carbon-monoxide dehydrogenase small subunit